MEDYTIQGRMKKDENTEEKVKKKKKKTARKSEGRRHCKEDPSKMILQGEVKNKKTQGKVKKKNCKEK